jgi:Holliday junction resolvase-like predicted endonuclease
MSIEDKNKDNRTDKRKVGDIGENAVCAYLKSKGFTILEQNYLRKWGELDIIAKKVRKIHFVEVKSISREIVSNETKNGISRENYPRYVEEYRAEDNLHPEKLKRLKRAIQTYKSDRKISDKTEWQFDVATVHVDQARKICKVSILEDIII